jgi:hypothetical protein
MVISLFGEGFMRNSKFSKWLGLSFVFLPLLNIAGVTQASGSGPSYYVRLAKDGQGAEALGLEPRLQLDYGSFTWLELGKNDYEKLAGRKADFSLDPNAAQVRVRGFAFDPLAEGEPTLTKGLQTMGTGAGLRLIQFTGPVQGGWLNKIEASGLRVLQYYPHNTYLVWGSANLNNATEALDFVRWQGEFHPAYKTGPGLDKVAGEIHNLAITFYNDGNTDQVLEEIKALGGGYLRHFAAQPDQAFITAIFSLDASRVAEVANIAQVWAIEYLSPTPGLDDENGAQIVAGNYSGSPAKPFTGFFTWLTNKGIDGSGITWADVDTGLNGTHPDIAGRSPVYVSYPTAGSANTDPDGHGSHTAGAIFGDPRTAFGGTGIQDPNGFYWGLGAAPRAGMVIQNALWSDVWPPTGGWQLLSKDSVINGAMGSSNSWYTGATGAQGYSAAARTHDIMVRDANFDTPTIAEPLIMVFSAGNAGPGSSTMTEPKEAKNLITVGASDNYPRTGASINGLADFSSRGPALDGRLLPNVTAPGVQTASWNGSGVTCGTKVSGSGANYYNYCQGTSMAAPFVSGASALIGQWWGKQGRGTPSPAMTKALLINGASDMVGGNYVSGTIPNNNQGWGRVNLGSVIDNGASWVYHDQDTLFKQTGETRTYRIKVPSTASPVKVSLVWTDAPGAAGASPALVNDLHLKVVSGGNTYRGNVFSGGWSSTGGTDDILNNIENVYIQSPGATLEVTVTAANIAGDGVPYNGYPIDQDFALVCSNCIEVPTPVFCWDCLPNRGGWRAVLGQ